MMRYVVVIFSVAACASAGQLQNDDVDAGLVDCSAGETQVCTADDGCEGQGVRACEDGVWGPCRDPDGVACECDDGAVQSCIQGNGEPGSEFCEGGIWSACTQRVERIAAGHQYSCAVVSGGDAICWGANQWGQLGYGNTQSIGAVVLPLFADPVSAGGALADVAAGFTHSCAVRDSGDIYCWGEGRYGALGYGNATTIGDNESPDSAGPVAIGGVATKVVAGNHFSCALLDVGSVRCWGLGSWGRLGHGSTSDIGDNELPNDVATVRLDGAATDLVAGDHHVCALLDTGAVRCWGRNSSGMLGQGDTQDIGDDELPDAVSPVALGGLATQIATGTFHTCALLSAGTVRCWGLGSFGQLGYGNTHSIGDNERPSDVGTVAIGATAVAIAAGGAHTCVITESRGVRCWGANGAGQLGYGHTETIGDNETPASAGDIPLGDNAVAIAVGNAHTCAIVDAGGVRCWGSGALGALGYGNTDNIGDNDTPSLVGDVPLF